MSTNADEQFFILYAINDLMNFLNRICFSENSAAPL